MDDRFEIIDTWPDFCDYWSQVHDLGLHEQIALWRNYYMSDYPELFQMQVDNYASEGIDWRVIAEKIFPDFPERIDFMEQARNSIIENHRSICSRAFDKLGLDFDLVLVIYVGTGCGAGWATAYAGKSALLLGLENIAEEGWHTVGHIKGLISHEIGHLAHMRWRAGLGSMDDDMRDPLFHLYSEGFAQRCEHVVNGKDTWHMAPDVEWLSWCGRNLGRLAAEFLRRVETGTPVRDFFGSWYNIEGRKMTGYYMGHAFVFELEKTLSLKEVAVLDINEVRKLATEYLSAVAAN